MTFSSSVDLTNPAISRFLKDGARGLVCYNLAGELQWTKSLGPFPYQAGWGSGSSPILLGDAVVIQCDNDQDSFLAGFDKRTGDELWRIARD